jgi:hypothetical protein
MILCVYKSSETVKLMVNEYNTYVSHKTDRKIKAWQFNNLQNVKYNGGVGQAVNL